MARYPMDLIIFPFPGLIPSSALTQMTQVVYMEKPMNLASLKFSGRFLVLMA